MKAQISSRILPFLFLIIIITGMIPQIAHAKNTTIQVELNGKTKKYTNTGETVTLNGKTISTKDIPSVKINSVWMVSISEVFENGLGCTYTYDNSGKITITNLAADITASLTVGSKTAIIDEKTCTLPVPVVEAVNSNNDKTGILVPVSYLAKRMGYTYTYQSSTKKIALTTIIFLDKDVKIPQYDTSVYKTVLTTVIIKQNAASTRETFDLMTSGTKTTADNVKIVEDEANGILTYTLLNTYNAVGNISKTYSTGFVKKIAIQSSGYNTIVTITFKNKYVYTTLLEEDGVYTSFSSSNYSMKIQLPTDVKFSKVKNTDLYYKKQFRIDIPGTWTEFYESNPVISNSNMIQSIKVSSNSAGNTRILVKTKKLQGYKLTEKNGYFIVSIDEPKKIYENIVVLDAGHGGKDSGATNKGTKEKNLNYTIVYAKAKKLFDSKDSNVKAYWTRTDDTFITLANRAKFASTVGADLFVSLHMNSCTKSSVNGLEVYYSKDNNRTTYNGLTSQILAKRMLNTLKADLNCPSRGVKYAGFYVMKYNTVPAILLELGFLSGNADYGKLTSDSYQTRSAQSIYKCIESVFASYPTNH